MMGTRALGRTSALGLAAVLVLSACTGTVEPTETPTTPQTTQIAAPTESPTEAPTSADTAEPFDPVTGEPAPPMPETVDGWELEPGAQGIGYYRHPGGDATITTYMWTLIDREESQYDMPDSSLLGVWLCGSESADDEYVYCSADAWNGAVQLMSQHHTAEELAAFGEELLAAWGAS